MFSIITSIDYKFFISRILIRSNRWVEWSELPLCRECLIRLYSYSQELVLPFCEIPWGHSHNNRSSKRLKIVDWELLNRFTDVAATFYEVNTENIFLVQIFIHLHSFFLKKRTTIKLSHSWSWNYTQPSEYMMRTLKFDQSYIIGFRQMTTEYHSTLIFESRFQISLCLFIFLIPDSGIICIPVHDKIYNIKQCVQENLLWSCWSHISSIQDNTYIYKNLLLGRTKMFKYWQKVNKNSVQHHETCTYFSILCSLSNWTSKCYVVTLNEIDPWFSGRLNHLQKWTNRSELWWLPRRSWTWRSLEWRSNYRRS